MKKYENAIKNWPKDERPREKLLKFGEHTLTNSELLAIMQVSVLDHVIIGDNNYYSFADQGEMKTK